jgi:hypothetical protein
MIIILKRYDLPEEHSHRAVADLELKHFELSSELIDQAELIVLVDGTDIKFLKHSPEIQPTNNIDVLAQYITGPSSSELPQWRVKRYGHRREP